MLSDYVFDDAPDQREGAIGVIDGEEPHARQSNRIPNAAEPPPRGEKEPARSKAAVGKSP